MGLEEAYTDILCRVDQGSIRLFVPIFSLIDLEFAIDSELHFRKLDLEEFLRCGPWSVLYGWIVVVMVGVCDGGEKVKDKMLNFLLEVNWSWRVALY